MNVSGFSVKRCEGIALFGSESLMSAVVLKRLVVDEVVVRAMVFYERRRTGFAVEKAGSVADLAARTGVPVFRIGDWADSAVLQRILESGATTFLCACFPRRMPAAWFQAAPAGAFNLHPSRLPGYRGPVPLFWQFRDGLSEFGVSLHVLDEGLDTGPVLAVKSLPVRAGESGAHVLERLSNLGADMVSDCLASFGPRRFRQIQSGAPASYLGWPRRQDCRLDPKWPADRLFRFVSGVSRPGLSFEISWRGRMFEVTRVVGRVERTAIEGFANGLLTVQCNLGALRFQARESRPFSSAPPR